MQRTTERQIRDLAAVAGLDVRASRPGDGATRYELTAPAGYVLAYACGAQDAARYLRGYLDGCRHIGPGRAAILAQRRRNRRRQ